MNFVLRSFAGYVLLIALAAFFGYRIAMNELKPAMRQAVEELLVDCANLLAEVAAPDVAAGRDALSAASVQRAHLWRAEDAA
jgi:two-component system sensor histidine kinase CreC